MRDEEAQTAKSMRLDAFLAARGAYESRRQAQDAIRAGLVRVNGAVAAKPSLLVRDDDRVECLGKVHPYVSRGGLKLEAALTAMAISPEGRVCLDLGASTGGFSDVLLRAGAARIYAVDVGVGQLHPAIAGAPQVVNLEKTHARDLTPRLVPEPVELIVCDVSFISLKKALPPALALAAAGARLVALVKPQFEAGPDALGKGGIAPPAVGRRCAAEIRAWLEAQPGWRVLDLIDSPIAGGDGNREYLIGAARAG